MEKGKLIVFVGVATVHVAAIAFFKHLVRQPVHRTDVFSTWILGEVPVMQPTGDPTQLEHRGVQVPKIPLPVSVRSAEMPTATSIPESNWYAAGEQAVGAAIARQSSDAERSLRSAPTTIELPTLFESPLYKNGDSQRFDDGEINTWIGPECFATNRPYGPPPENLNQVKVICKGNVGKRKADDSLFDHLRPRYLREDPAVSVP